MRYFLGIFFGFIISTNACEKALDPTRITSAGGSVTEIIFFLNAEDNLIAVDVTSNYPQEAMKLPSIGYVRQLSAEGVLSLDPSIIIGEDDMGPPSVLDQIERTNVEITIVPEDHDVEGILEKIRCIASVIGIDSEAIINTTLAPKIEKLNQLTHKNKEKKIIYILGMQSGSPLVAGNNTSGNGLINISGGINPFNSFEGWKPVGTESIIEASPDLIIISERGLKGFGTMEDLRMHPALYLTPASQNNKIISIDGMASLGFGPRTIDAAIKVSETLNGIN